jgi:hypothetical protein
MWRTIVLVTLLFAPLIASDVASGQQSSSSLGPGRPIEGATDGLYVPSKPQSDLTPVIKLHTDAFGKACIVVVGYSHAKTDFAKIFGGQTSPNSADASTNEQGHKSKLYEHIISAQNRCSQTIRVHVCYYASQTCVAIRVPGHDHEQASLGTSSGIPGFRYQYTEQF